MFFFLSVPPLLSVYGGGFFYAYALAFTAMKFPALFPTVKKQESVRQRCLPKVYLFSFA